jgi:DNA polymerase-3 subunit gamma/tau
LQQIVAQLRRVVDAEEMKLSDSSLALVARAAEGGMRDALSLLDRVRAACGDGPDDAAVAEAVGAVDSAAVARLGWGLVRRDGATLLAEVEALYQRGQEMKRVAEEVVRHLRNLTVAKLVPSAPLDLPDVERREVEAQAASAEPAQLARLFDIAQRAVTEVKLSEQPRFALEVALLKGALLAPGAEVSDLVARLERMAGDSPLPRSSPRPVAATMPTATPTPTPIQTAPPTSAAISAPTSTPAPDHPSLPIADRWRALVVEVEKVSPSTAAALKQGALLWVREGEVGVQFIAGSSFAAQAERKRAEVEKVFAAFFGQPTRLAIQTGPAPEATAVAAAPIAAMEQAEREARSSKVRDTARSHPNIQEAAKVLGAKIEGVEEL